MVTTAQDIDPFTKEVLTRVHGPQRILDVGCGLGKAGLYMWLAGKGHRIVGIDIAPEVITDNQAGLDLRYISQCMFELKDMRGAYERFSKDRFGLVLASNVLHLISKDEQTATITGFKNMTSSLGYNAISGYLVEPELSTSDANRARMFEPGELETIYNDDPRWRVLYYCEDDFRAQQVNGEEQVSSHAQIIAQKRT